MQTNDIAAVAAVLADPTRASMCLAMMDGRAWTVSELAAATRVAVSSASEQVTRLEQAGFVESLRQGRHRYVRLANPRVAELVELLTEHTERRPVRDLRASLREHRLAFARTCYDHLAGTLGVALRDGMLTTGLIDDEAGLVLTAAGQEVLGRLDIGVPTRSRRTLLRDCLDWTERREHLGGALPAALLDHAVDRGWLARGTHRAIKILPAAHGPLAQFGVNVDELALAS